MHTPPPSLSPHPQAIPFHLSPLRYGLLDDDCFLYPDGLLTALSAFNPDEPWAFSQSNPGKIRNGGPTVWRMFGGAGENFFSFVA